MLATLIAAAALFAATENLLNDPGFGNGLKDWRTEATTGTATMSEMDGQACVSIHADAVDGYPRVVQEFPATPGALYSAEALARDEGITGGYGAYMTMEFLDAEGKRILFEQSSPALNGWTRLIARCVAPEGTARGLFCLVLRGAGTGLYRAPTVQLLEPAPVVETPSEVHLIFASPRKEPFLGFGFEDDGWLANRENAAKGVTEDDLQRIQSRAAWMNPASVRMFFWYKDFNPSGDWSTLDFDSDNMRSHYRALEVYQKCGAVVNVTGVEWQVKAPWSNPEGLTKAVGALFTELITKRGFTCVRKWTLTNEPNTHFLREGATFETYKQLHLSVAKEFAERGLKISVVGSDDTNGGLPWFTQCVTDPAYFDAMGHVASHFYFQRDSLRAGKYHLQDRLELLAGRKPFVIEEFGFQDSRSGAIVNPFMEEFDYALLTAAFAIDAVARGVSGLNVWCLHEMQYPVGYMNYGLFHYKDKDWSPKPVFYAWANLTRNTRAGAPVQAPAEPLPADLAAVRVGDSIFFVNRSASSVRFVIDGGAIKGVRVFDSDCMPVTTEEATIRSAADGRFVPLENGAFNIPPRSFGRAW